MSSVSHFRLEFKMATRKRTQEEKNLKTLRELAALPANKQCFDCHQRGPTYVNMTIGSFVCTSCSGILRGLNPPHRVKSITMTTFTPEEIEQIRSKGNEYCKYVWLGLYDSRCPMEPDSRDEQRIRDLMIQKYERKRWYVDPDVALHKMQQEQSRPSTAVQSPASQQPSACSTPTGLPPETKPLSSLLGKNSLPLVVHKSQPATPSSATWPTPISSAATMPTGQAAFKSNVDIFSAFGNDPFSSNSVGSTPTVPTKTTSFSANGNFANFESAFSRTGLPDQTPVSSGVTNGDGGFVASFPSATQPTAPAPAAPATTTPATGGGEPQNKVPPADRYAALADLDNLFHQEAAATSPPPPPVTYGPAVGPVFGAAAVVAAPPSNPFVATPVPAPVPWGMTAVPSQPTVAPAVFSNPFEVIGSPSQAQQPVVGGPFGGLDGTSHPAPHHPPPPGGMFGTVSSTALQVHQQAFVSPQLSTVTSPPNGVVAPSVQKDGYAGWGSQGAPWGTSTLGPSAKTTQQFGAWTVPQSPVNPFLSAQMPRTNSSNPFL